MTLRIYANLDTLPSDVVQLFDAGARDDVFASLAWFRVLTQTALPDGDAPVLAVLDDAQGPLAALPLCRRAASERAPGAREIASLANFYSCAFAPLIRAGAACTDAAERLAVALAAGMQPYDLLDLHTLRADDPATAALARGLRTAGAATQSYFHFGNWYERVADDTFATYMARRPAALRNTVARKQRKLARDHALELKILSSPPELARSIAAYEQVYAASWKSAEPYPGFTARLVRDLGAGGHVRLGLALVDGAPIAAQIWLFAATRATIFKLAHDERRAELSAGSILTAHLMQHAIDAMRVREIDFGRGDDDYKKSWLASRRECRGLIACNTRSWRGLAAALRHVWLPGLRRRFGGRAARA